MATVSALLYSCIDHRSESGPVEKKVIWGDDFIEINSIQPNTNRSRLSRISCALVASMAQSYADDITVLWRLLAESIQYYEDRIIFSTQHISYFSQTRDSRARMAYSIYEVSCLESSFFVSIPLKAVFDFLALTDKQEFPRWNLLESRIFNKY